MDHRLGQRLARLGIAVAALLTLSGGVPPAAAAGALVAVGMVEGVPDRVAAQDAPEQATLETMRPEVQWSPTGSIRWQLVPLRQSVRAGDRVRTGPAATARLVYYQGTVTEVGPETALLVQQLERAPEGNVVTRLFQSLGSTVNSVLHVGEAPVIFEIETPTVTARAGGTTPQLTVEPDGSTRVTNVSDGTGGIVDVVGKDADATRVTLQPGEETIARPGQAPAPPTLIGGACGERFQAQYFIGPELSGAPLATRCEGQIAFDWGDRPPAPGLGFDNFSVRWTGPLLVANTGEYTFRVAANDGVRLTIDGQRILDEWASARDASYAARQYLTRGSHTVIVEYRTFTRPARVVVFWPVDPD